MFELFDVQNGFVRIIKFKNNAPHFVKKIIVYFTIISKLKALKLIKVSSSISASKNQNPLNLVALSQLLQRKKYFLTTSHIYYGHYLLLFLNDEGTVLLLKH